MSDCVCGHRMSGTPASRREFLARCGMGFGALGLVNLLAEDILTAGGQAPQLQFAAKAKHVIHIFAQGAPSQVDTWDPKPALTKWHGQALPGLNGVAMASPFKFAKHGQSGIEVSEVFPALAAARRRPGGHPLDADRHSRRTTSRTVIMNTGSLRMVKPSLGAWVLYGLGSANENMPGYISLRPNGGLPPGGALNWGSAFLPGDLQGRASTRRRRRSTG